MKALKQIFDDIKQGENLDLYLTIVTALLVAGLNLLSITPPNLINSLVLATFAIIASSLIGNRHRLDTIQKRLGETTKEGILKEYPENELNRDMERANEIWVIGIHAVSFRHHCPELETKIRKGKNIRVLLVDPDGHACSMVASRYPGKPSLVREQAIIRTSLNDLIDLKSIPSSKFQLRVIDDALTFGGYIINPNSRDSVMYIQRYTYQTGVIPKYMYYPDSEWFESIKSEFLSLWNRGRDWQSDKTKESI